MSRVWPALFFVIFHGIKRTGLVERALKTIQVNKAKVSKCGYQVGNARLDKPDTIEVEVSQLQLTRKHKMKTKATFTNCLEHFPSLCLSVRHAPLLQRQLADFPSRGS